MADLIWIASTAAGAACLAAGLLGWWRARSSHATQMFLIAMLGIFFAMFTGGMYSYMDTSQVREAELVMKSFAISSLLGLAFLFNTAIAFPIDRGIALRPMNRNGALVVLTSSVAIVLGATAELDVPEIGGPSLDHLTAGLMIGFAALVVSLATYLILVSTKVISAKARKASIIYLAGLWITALTGFVFAVVAMAFEQVEQEMGLAPVLPPVFGVAVTGVLFAISIASGQMNMVLPAAEKMASSAKAKFNLLHRRVYLVEERKPEFSFRMFSDILKGRCFDCEDDESFTCESLECGSCKLPCPCRDCTKYKSRTQGLIITRQYPNEIRSKFFLQTTPILWVSTVSGKDSIDPAKLNLMTDYIVKFIEESENGVVLVDGIEYLMTANDFTRLLKSVDRWTETAVTTTSRLIISLDPQAFEGKELALLERNREVVRPDASEEWMIIPESV
ncbi:MAG TPA: DUF835 domain-containing protein [Thermoplasmata archaeon]